ncbi:uncharacterized protein MONBRDRAFT_7792 [Monosiga brevicollis MX1]|uniref:RCC1-like domain-containing protein n=1 Tax=Monosiga brevicollis TaxID=81824 RepID=A9UXF3_MONBE|nr:uncharacterized protein MONBRDRAFT_7792 [Monosiga brevicollis MX1]EDQ89835.1 predicted protein [Monosiga brevicollis MX1]|eukprot:XP_001745257.1 hypothetical protein [Monosiga brevicollis MX1]
MLSCARWLRRPLTPPCRPVPLPLRGVFRTRAVVQRPPGSLQDVGYIAWLSKEFSPTGQRPRPPHICVCGWNSAGQLALNNIEPPCVPHLTMLPPWPGVRRVNRVACGWDFTYFVVEGDASSLLVCGSNKYGQLGLPSSVSLAMAATAHPLGTAHRIIRAAAGMRHGAVVTANGAVLTAGQGRHGQLGRPLADAASCDFAFEACAIPSELSSKTLVACGTQHTVIAHHATVWGCGANRHGQLGRHPTTRAEARRASTLLTRLTDFSVPIAALHAGWSHTTAILANGQVQSWGRRDYGQLGAPLDVDSSTHDSADRLSCATLRVPDGTRAIALGSEHALLLTAASPARILAWGWNEHGNVGRPPTSEPIVETPIPVPTHGQPILVLAGGAHSIVLQV